MPTIERLRAMEILDSRGRPTVSATCLLADGVVASASVPSGASTGTAEAIELRDGEPHRYGGLGCRRAVIHVNEKISPALHGLTFQGQAELDQALIDLDGTSNKSNLGANAILAVSIAFARASAMERGVPLYRHFADMAALELATLPRMTINLFSGGKHAGGQVPIQDVLVVPVSARSIDEGLAMVYDVYQAAVRHTFEHFAMRALKADEGGLAPPFKNAEQMLQHAVKCITDAGYKPGKDIAIAVDVASSQFYHDNVYELGDVALESHEMIDLITRWVNEYPIVSVEDALAEDDWNHWPVLREAIKGKALVLGDDLLCTNPRRIQQAIDAAAADALLLKVNQIGTLTEAATSLRLAREAGWKVTISARSGETEDHWLADLAVGWRGDQIKVGSIMQSERLAKYNRLLAIEAETHLGVVHWPNS